MRSHSFCAFIVVTGVWGGCASDENALIESGPSGKSDLAPDSTDPSWLCDADEESFDDFLNHATDMISLEDTVARQMGETIRLFDENAELEAFDLFDRSSGGDVSVYRWTTVGRSFTAIEFYPGDNAYGFIFKDETLDIVASINDAEILCSDADAGLGRLCDPTSTFPDSAESGPASLNWYFEQLDEQSLYVEWYTETMAKQFVAASSLLNDDENASIESLFLSADAPSATYYSWSDADTDQSFQAVRPDGTDGIVFKGGSTESVARFGDEGVVCEDTRPARPSR